MMKKEKKKQTFQKENHYGIDVNGSLGLLAIGDKGLRAWRKVRDAKKEKKG